MPNTMLAERSIKLSGHQVIRSLIHFVHVVEFLLLAHIFRLNLLEARKWERLPQWYPIGQLEAKEKKTFLKSNSNFKF